MIVGEIKSNELCELLLNVLKRPNIYLVNIINEILVKTTDLYAQTMKILLKVRIKTYLLEFTII